VYNDVADRENIDPFWSGKSRISRLRAESAGVDDTESESSFETVVHYNSKAEWSQSTPATGGKLGRKSMSKRKSMKRKSSVGTTGLYPEVSVYPDLSAAAPTTSTDEFGKIAQGIVEEMNTRIAGSHTLSFPRLTGSKTNRKPSRG
jgi:hypothetical protein